MSTDVTTTIFTVEKVAELCEVAPRTVNKWLDSKRLKVHFTIRSSADPSYMERLIHKYDLEQFLKEHGMNSVLNKLAVSSNSSSLQIAKDATKLLQQHDSGRCIKLLAGMMRTCCVTCDAYTTCEFAYDPYNVDCKPKIDCLAVK